MTLDRRGQGTTSVYGPQRRRRPLSAFQGVVRATPGFVLDPGWPQPSQATEASLVAAVNVYRVTVGRATLLPAPALSANSEWKASDQAEYLYMDHNQPAVDGQPASTVADRFAAFGFGNVAWGENIAYGFTSVESVMQAWLSDQGHKQNIENPSWTHVGCGVATATRLLYDLGTPERHPLETDLTWWVQDFAALTQPPPPPVVPPVKGSHWRLKLNPLAKPVTVTGYAAGMVLAQNRKGQPLTPIPLAAFLRRYTPA